jgi:hypothetical protein
MGERNTHKILVGKPEGKRPLGRPRRRWVDTIKIYVKERGWGGMDWIELDRDKRRVLLDTVMNLRVPYRVERFLSSCVNGGFSRRAQLYDVS